MNSQIDTITDHTAKLQDTFNEYDKEIKKDQFETEKKFKDSQKAKMSLEADVRQLENEINKEA